MHHLGKNVQVNGAIPMYSLMIVLKKTTLGNLIESTNMGVSLNGGTPISHPKIVIFSRKTHGFVGKAHHFRKPPYKSSDVVLL